MNFYREKRRMEPAAPHSSAPTASHADLIMEVAAASPSDRDARKSIMMQSMLVNQKLRLMLLNEEERAGKNHSAPEQTHSVGTIDTFPYMEDGTFMAVKKRFDSIRAEYSGENNGIIVAPRPVSPQPPPPQCSASVEDEHEHLQYLLTLGHDGDEGGNLLGSSPSECAAAAPTASSPLATSSPKNEFCDRALFSKRPITSPPNQALSTSSAFSTAAHRSIASPSYTRKEERTPETTWSSIKKNSRIVGFQEWKETSAVVDRRLFLNTSRSVPTTDVERNVQDEGDPLKLTNSVSLSIFPGNEVRFMSEALTVDAAKNIVAVLVDSLEDDKDASETVMDSMESIIYHSIYYCTVLGRVLSSPQLRECLEEGAITMRKLVVITYRWFIDPPTLLQLVKKAALNALKYGFDISLYLYPFFEDLITFVSNDFRKHLMRNKLFELLQSFLSKDEVYKLTDLFKLIEEGDTLRRSRLGNLVIQRGGAESSPKTSRVVENAGSPEDGSVVTRQHSGSFTSISIESHNWQSLNILDLKSREIAEQFCLLDFDRFSKLEASEFYGGAWTKPNKAKLSPTLTTMAQRFNEVYQWTYTEIFAGEGVREQTKLLKRFVNIATELRRLRNFQALVAIVAGLHHPCVVQMKEVWKVLPEKYWDRFENIQNLMSPLDNFSVYRKALREAEIQPGPLIPYMPVHLRDIMFADGGNNDVSEDGTKVNVFKIRSLGRCIYHLLKYARIPYDLPRNAQLQQKLANIKIPEFNQDAMRSLSGSLKHLSLKTIYSEGELSRSPDFGKSCPEISKLIMESASDLLRKNIPLSSSILSSPSSSSTCGSSSPPSSSASPREFTKQPTTLALLIQGHDIDDSVEIELTSEEGTPEELICHSPSFLEFMSYLETDSNSDDDGHTTRATSPPVGSVSSISGSPSSSACSAGQIVPCNRLSPSSCSPSSLRVAEAISTLNHHRKSAEVLPNSADKERPLIAAKRRKSDVSSSPSITEQESHDMDGLVLISPVQSDDASDTSSVSGDGSPRVANEDKCMNLRRSSSSWVSARKKSASRKQFIGVGAAARVLDFVGLVRAMREPNTGVPLRDRTHNVFLGIDAVSWLMQHLDLKERKEAVSIGQSLLEQHFLHHVVYDYPFLDKKIVYRFQELDVTESTLNKVETQMIERDSFLYTLLYSMAMPLHGLRLKDRLVRMRLFKKCFTGVEGVDWLVKNLSLARNVALSIGENHSICAVVLLVNRAVKTVSKSYERNVLVVRGYIVCMMGDKPFADEPHMFYRFTRKAKLMLASQSYDESQGGRV